MEVVVPDHVPANWSLPPWNGLCDNCGSESLYILCTVENNKIVMYDLWVECSWCKKSFAIDAPNEGD